MIGFLLNSVSTKQWKICTYTYKEEISWYSVIIKPVDHGNLLIRIASRAALM